MRFSIQHSRAVAGNDITVGVEGDGPEVIARVTTNLDGFEIGDDEVAPPCVSYERQFLRAGEASPLMEHELVVTVTDTQGNTKSADGAGKMRRRDWDGRGSAMMSKLK